MSKPKEEIKEKEYYKEIHFLYEILNNMKDVEEIKLFVKDILTKSELRMIKRRWHIANLLNEGKDIRTAANKSKTSTTTVLKIKLILEEGTGGLKLALDRSIILKDKERNNFIRSKQSIHGSTFVSKLFK